MKAKLLLVEDDENLGFVVSDRLRANDFEVVLAKDGESAFETFQKQRFDLCLLDIMLPKLDGINLARMIRKADRQIPLLMLTAKSMEEDKIEGFGSGADDYITKPFSMEELLCRIEVFLKRRSFSSADEQNDPLHIGTYQFDPENLALSCNGTKRKITKREADLLQYLIDNQERVVKREDILEKLWGANDYFAGRSMDVFISKLRKYLSADKRIEIANYHGVGFMLKVKET